MNAKEIRRVEMFRRVRDFGVTYVNAFAAGSPGRELLETIAAVLDELEDAGAAQSAARGTSLHGTAGKAAARSKLRQTVETISRTARSMAFTTPGAEEKFLLPRRSNDQELLNTARAFVIEATPLKAEFIKYEMRADFLDTLQQDIHNLEQSMLEQFKGNKARVSARATIGAAVERGVEAVRRLTPIVRNKFHDQPSALAAWESARHTERPPRTRPREEEEAAAPPAQ